MSYVKVNSQAEDYKVKQNRLCIPFSIVHNATPASKTSSNDLPSSMYMDLEGILSASAVDSGCNFTTPADATGIFGILLANLGTIQKCLTADVVGLSSGTVAVSKKGASSSGVTASGNLAVSVDWSGDLSATDLSATLVVDYKISK
jgi:hypothetical protein